MKINTHLFSALLVTSLLSSCGGGGGGGNSGNEGSSSSIPQDQNANGIWLGTTSNSEYGSSDTYGLFYDGEFVALNVQFNEFYKGTYSIDQDDVSATGKGYTLNGPYGGTGSINGVVSSQGTLLATVEASIGTTSSLALDYSSDLYERSISFADLEGFWSGSVTGLSYNIAIDSSGFFTAAGSDGCIAYGDLDIPNPNRNMIKADRMASNGTHSTIRIFNCVVRGDYTGFGILADDGTINDSIIFGYANDYNGYAYIAYRDNTDIGTTDGSSPSIVLEFEPNDSVGQELAFDQTVVGQLSSASDVDKYRLNVSGAGRINLHFGFEKIYHGNHVFGWTVELIDPDGAIHWSRTCFHEYCDTSGSHSDVPVSQAGEYSVVVRGRSTNTIKGLYTLKTDIYL